MSTAASSLLASAAVPVPTRRRRPAATALVALVAVVATACSKGDGKSSVLAPGEKKPTGITVTSTAFDHGDAIPERFSCEGENVPPPLRWTGVPAGATELALVIEDPDAPEGIFVHWLVVGIGGGATGLEGTEPPVGAEVLAGSSDNPTYIGPCPPDGDGDHRYVFEVYSLEARPTLDASSAPVDKVRAIRRAATAGGWLIGTFAR